MCSHHHRTLEVYLFFSQIYIFYTEVFFPSGSLVATLRVAEHFDKSHLLSPKVAPLVESVKLFYMDGYFLTHGLESALHLGNKSSSAGKVVSFSTTRIFAD